MLQRMEVLHERLMHFRFCCPLQQEVTPQSTEVSGPESLKDSGSDPAQDTGDLEAQTAGELNELADSLVAMVAPLMADADGLEQRTAGGGTDLNRVADRAALHTVLLSSELLFWHASSLPRASLLRLLQSLSSAAQPCGAAETQSLHADDDLRQVATRVLHSTELLEEPGMETEWVHAAAAIVHNALSATCAPSRKARPGHAAAAVTHGRPSRKGKGTSQDESSARERQGSQDANALQRLMLSIDRLALPRPAAPSNATSDSVSGCDALLSALESCTSDTGRAAPSIGAAHPPVLQPVFRLFTELARLPAQYYAARGCVAAELTNLALLTQAAVMRLMCCGGCAAQARMSVRDEVAGLLKEECLGALQATQDFLATAAGSGSRPVLDMLGGLAHAHLHWPFVIASRAHITADVGGSADGWQHSAVRSMLGSSAVIMGSIVRHGLAGGGMQAAGASLNDPASHDGGGAQLMGSIRRFLEDMTAKFAASPGRSGSVGAEPEVALQIATLAASLVASLAGPCADVKRRLASSIFAGELPCFLAGGE